MTVREITKLLEYGTSYILIGAKSGKKLTNIYTKEKAKEKYMDMSVTDAPIGVSFYEGKNPIIKTTNYVKPIIYIWVSGI